MIRLQELELVFGHTTRTYVRTDGWTHRRDVGNSILDYSKEKEMCIPINTAGTRLVCLLEPYGDLALFKPILHPDD